jgi:predicted component of type VI protein secretion system
VNSPYALACSKCNTLLFEPKRSTVIMRVDPALLRLRRAAEAGGSSVAEHKVQLIIRGVIERVAFEDGTELVLGRTDLGWSETDRFDLTRYGAHERGVSRAHAVLRYRDGQLTITDLSSVNGTSLNMKRLPPNEPHIVSDNDEIMLGRLAVRVRFVPAGDTDNFLMVNPNTNPAANIDPPLPSDDEPRAPSSPLSSNTKPLK